MENHGNKLVSEHNPTMSHLRNTRCTSLVTNFWEGTKLAAPQAGLRVDLKSPHACPDEEDREHRGKIHLSSEMLCARSTASQETGGRRGKNREAEVLRQD